MPSPTLAPSRSEADDTPDVFEADDDDVTVGDVPEELRPSGAYHENYKRYFKNKIDHLEDYYEFTPQEMLDHHKSNQLPIICYPSILRQHRNGTWIESDPFDYAYRSQNYTHPCVVPLDAGDFAGGADPSYALPLYGLVFPFVVTVTVLVNAAVCVVLLKAPLRSPTNVLLAAIALADTLTGIFPLPLIVYIFTFGGYHDWVPQEFCNAYILTYQVLPTIFHSVSIWLTVGLAVQRYIYICHPIKARSICTIPNVIKGAVFVLLGCILLQCPRFFEKKFLYIDYPSKQNPAEMISTCVSLPSKWIHGWVPIYMITYFSTRVVVVHIIPCILLVVTNSLLVDTMREANERRLRLLQSNIKQKRDNARQRRLADKLRADAEKQQREKEKMEDMEDKENKEDKNDKEDKDSRSVSAKSVSGCPTPDIDQDTPSSRRPSNLAALEQTKKERKKRREARCTTLMLVIVVTVFLAVELPLTFIFIVEIVQTLFSSVKVHIDNDALSVAVFMFNFFIVLSYPTNFFIYCVMSKQFRREFSKMFTFARRKAPRGLSSEVKVSKSIASKLSLNIGRGAKRDEAKVAIYVASPTSDVGAAARDYRHLQLDLSGVEPSRDSVFPTQMSMLSPSTTERPHSPTTTSRGISSLLAPQNAENPGNALEMTVLTKGSVKSTDV